MWTALQIVPVTAGNSAGAGGGGGALCAFLCARISECAGEVCPAQGGCIPGMQALALTGSSLHPWWASADQMDGLSRCQRGDSWQAQASPGRGSGTRPLTAPDSSRWVTGPPSYPPPLSSLHHGNSTFAEESM